MRRIASYNEAAAIASSLPYCARVVICLKDGSIVSGTIDTVESELDDPNGVGCIDVCTDSYNNYGKSVYADQFAWAELDEGGHGA